MATARHWAPTILLTLAVVANLRGNRPAIGLTFGVAYLLWHGFLAGSWIAPQERRRWQLVTGLIAHLAWLTVAGAAAYWFYRLNPLAIGLLLIGTSWVWLKLHPAPPPRPALTVIYRDLLRGLPRTIGISTVLLLSFLAFALIHLRWLQAAATTGAIRTPWQVVAPGLFLNYLLLTLAALTLTVRTDRAGRRLPISLLTIALSLAVPLLVYPLGFGFDPAIHQATERAIAESGQILPKPPYYLGQYALVVVLSKILALSVASVDRLVAPVGVILAALLLYRPWRTWSYAAALPLLLLTLPYGAISFTTPQALGNLWLLLTVLATTSTAFAGTAVRWRPLSWLTAAAAAATHPIAGVPALATVAVGWLVNPDGKPARRAAAKTFLITVITVTAAAALPLLFTLQATGSGYPAPAVWRWANLGERVSQLRATVLPLPPSSNAPLLDFTYTVDRYRWWLLGIAAAAGVAALPWQRRWRVALPPLLASVAMLISFLVLSLGVTFPQLTASEQQIFPHRAFELAQLSLLPLIVVGGATVLHRCRRETVLRASLLVLLPAILTAQFYLAYPRADRYHFDHGFNLTAADIVAVRHVAADAQGDYLVLANQMTAAAAVREFGFFRSYPAADGSARQYFAYPIPTGEPLHRKFLEMVERRPTKAIAREAAELVAADLRSVYFILPAYWENFVTIAETARQEADRWWDIADGQVLVFRYDLPQ